MSIISDAQLKVYLDTNINTNYNREITGAKHNSWGTDIIDSKVNWIDFYMPWVDINRSGFLNQTETTLTFDDTTYTFTLAPTGTEWSYYYEGRKYTITGAKTIDLTTVESPLVDTTVYYITLDSTDGTLSVSTSRWDLLDPALPVVTIHWDSTMTPKYWIGEERHTVLVDRRWHYYHHVTHGTEAITIGALSGYTLDSNTDTDKVFAIEDSKTMDEDIVHTQLAHTKPNAVDSFYLQYYRTGVGSWSWRYSNMPFIYNSGTNLIQWDDGGTLTDASSSGGGALERWINSYILLTNIYGNDGDHIIITGQNEYNDIDQALAENPYGFDIDGIGIEESLFAWRLTWSTNGGNTGGCNLASVTLIEETSSSSVISSVSEWVRDTTNSDLIYPKNVSDLITIGGTTALADDSVLGVYGRVGQVLGSSLSTAFGYGSLQSEVTTSANYNTAFGYESLSANTVGASNVAIGYQALRFTSTGNYNVALGQEAGYKVQTGSYNISIGYRTNYSNYMSGSYNVVIGNNISLGTTDSYRLNIADIITGDISNGIVEINNILSLTPRAAAPSSPTQGMIWVLSTDGHLYYYNGTTSIQLD